jgi:hypothetical protein
MWQMPGGLQMPLLHMPGGQLMNMPRQMPLLLLPGGQAMNVPQQMPLLPLMMQQLQQPSRTSRSNTKRLWRSCSTG